MSIPWQIVEGKALRCIGINFKVQCLHWRPLCTCDSSTLDALRVFLGGNVTRRFRV